MQNLWILTEERPKLSVIRQILDQYGIEYGATINYYEEFNIKPIIVNNIFTFDYLVEGVIVTNIENMLNSDGLIPPSIDLDTINYLNEQFGILKDSYDAIIKEYAILMDDLVDYSIQRYKNIYNRLVETYKKKIVTILSYIEEQEFNLSEIKFSISSFLNRK